MKSSVLFLIATTAFVSACAELPNPAAQETRLDREGTLNCAGTNMASPDFVLGTELDPARCGPQQQPIVQ